VRPSAARAARTRTVGDRERGYLTVEMLMAVAASLVVLVVVVNLLVVGYARGAARAALDEGVRAGARDLAPVATCQARAQAALEALTGALAVEVGPVACSVDDDVVVAEVDGLLTGWLPLVPDQPLQERAVGQRAVDHDPKVDADPAHRP